MKRESWLSLSAVTALTAGVVALTLTTRPTPRLPASPDFRRKGKRGSLVAFAYDAVTVANKKDGKTRTYLNVRGNISDLKRQAESALGAAMSDEVFVLGTIIASEAGGLPPIAKLGIGHTTVNAAKAARKNILQLAVPRGILGAQGFEGRGYAASSRPPTKQDVELANVVLKGLAPDPTGGAVQWDSPRVQRKAVNEQWAGYSRTPEQVAADRISRGKKMVVLPQISEDVLRFWRPERERTPSS